MNKYKVSIQYLSEIGKEAQPIIQYFSRSKEDAERVKILLDGLISEGIIPVEEKRPYESVIYG
jgi:hypothetical protein